MALHQAGHQCHAVGFDDVCAGRVELTAIGGDGADAVAVDQHVGGIGCGAGSVPHAAVVEENAGHWLHHDQFDRFMTEIRAFL